MIEFDEGDLLNRDGDFENNKIERRFSDMGRQIGELPNKVLSLTGRFSSNTREEQCLNASFSEPNGFSDLVTGVHNPPHKVLRTTPPDGTPRNVPKTPSSQTSGLKFTVYAARWGISSHNRKSCKSKCHCSKEIERSTTSSSITT